MDSLYNCPQLKDVSHLDAARDGEDAVAAWAQVSCLNVAHIHGIVLGKISNPIHAAIVLILLIRSANKVAQMRGRVVDVNPAPRSRVDQLNQALCR